MEDKTSIGYGSAAFLVKDASIKGNPDAPIYKWLAQEGFTKWRYSKGHYDGIDYVYINVNSKVYANGMPGIRVTKVIGDHAITLEEFFTIYEIYKKYENRTILQMTDDGAIVCCRKL